MREDYVNAEEDMGLQRVLEASLKSATTAPLPHVRRDDDTEFDENLRKAIEESLRN